MLIVRKKYKRDWKTSIYKKSVGISLDHYNFILETRGKKSIAGRLNEIIRLEYARHLQEKENAYLRQRQGYKKSLLENNQYDQ